MFVFGIVALTQRLNRRMLATRGEMVAVLAGKERKPVVPRFGGDEKGQEVDPVRSPITPGGSGFRLLAGERVDRDSDRDESHETPPSKGEYGAFAQSGRILTRP